ncbi:MAG: aldehyde ferredoxin oxidoreductase N-terminal domain-containing protein [Chloroflexota bacterium]
MNANGFTGGYAGRFLRVDLTRGTVEVEPTPDPATWLGPRGWNILYAWNELAPGTDAFDPGNPLVLSAGPLVGTGAPTAGRATVSTLSPRSYPGPMWTTASMGGYWGAELKQAGYDGILVVGRASAPCYLLIEDDRVSLEDASGLWGQGALATQRALKARHSARHSGQHQTVTIGPAGENQVRFAAIIHRLSNSVGNGGFGGVMGAKQLKAIVVRGTRGVPIADPAGFLEAVQYVWGMARGGLSGFGQVEQGYPHVACSHSCSVKCYARIARTPGKLMEGEPLRMSKCVNGSFVGGSHPAYRGVFVDGTEMFIPKPPGLGELGLDLGNLSEDLGLTAWLYDTWYRYLGGLQQLGIHEVLGVPIALEDPAWWRDRMLEMAYRQGVGGEMAEGLARFYDRHPIGPRYLAEFIESAGSRGHGWHREGRAMEPHPSPYWEYAALLYAVSTRDVTPSTHDFFFLNREYGYPKAPKAPEEIPQPLQELSERLYGSREAVFPGDAYIEHVTALHQHRAVIKDSVGVCDWIFPLLRRSTDTAEEAEALRHGEHDALYADAGAEAALLRPCTGMDWDIATMERPIAERIVALERCLEVRNHGRNRAEDELVIPHFQWSEKTDGTHLSADAHEFRALLDRYYDLRGWDRATGWPTRAKLAELGLGWAADELERQGRLAPDESASDAAQ